MNDRQTVIGDARVLTRVVHRAGTPEFLHGWSTGRVRQKGAVDLDGCFYSSTVKEKCPLKRAGDTGQYAEVNWLGKAGAWPVVVFISP